MAGLVCDMGASLCAAVSSLWGQHCVPPAANALIGHRVKRNPWFDQGFARIG